jgi:hypothetical protein
MTKKETTTRAMVGMRTTQIKGLPRFIRQSKTNMDATKAKARGPHPLGSTGGAAILAAIV